MTKEITAEIEVYYDVYEYEQGDGMYPAVGREREEDGCIKVGFVLRENRWLQTTGPYIYGLDGDNGIKFLEHLNENYYKPQMRQELQTTTYFVDEKGWYDGQGTVDSIERTE